MIASIIGAFSNAVRGGQWHEWFGVPDGGWRWFKSDFLNAAVFAALVALAGFSWHVWLFSFIMMLMGSAPGWGDYIGALNGYRTQNLKENRWIDPIIKKLNDQPFWWGFAGLTIRGSFWGICLALPMIIAAQYGVALAFVLAGATMGISYRAAYLWCSKKLVTEAYVQSAAWSLGEIFFGAVLWSPLNLLY